MDELVQRGIDLMADVESAIAAMPDGSDKMRSIRDVGIAHRALQNLWERASVSGMDVRPFDGTNKPPPGGG